MIDKILKKNVKNNKDMCLGLKIPMLRKINKKKKRTFDTQALEKIGKRFAYDSTEKETHYLWRD